VQTIAFSFAFISSADGGGAFSHQNLSYPTKESIVGSYHLNGKPTNDSAYEIAKLTLECAILMSIFRIFLNK
jgi:hypothetical protein